MNPLNMKRRSMGAVLLEFAILLPVFVALLFGSIEVGWSLYVQNAIADAARQGVRIAVTQDTSSSAVISAVDTAVENSNISTSDLSVSINPTTFSAQTKGTAISVTVSIPYSSISILPTPLFLGDTILEAEVTMVKEY